MYKQTVTLRKGSFLLILAMSTSLAVALTGCGGGGVSSIQGPVGSAPPAGVDGQPKPEVPSPVVTTETPPPVVTTAVSSPVVSNRAPGDSQAPATDTVVTDTVGSDLIENIEILAVGNHQMPIFEALEDATKAEHAATAMAKVAMAKPNNSGAPTQSTNFHSTSKVTTDSVGATPQSGSGGYRFSLSKSGNERWTFSGSEGLRDVISSRPGGYKEVDTRKGISSDTLYVNTFSNIDEILQFTGTVSGNSSTSVAVTSGDTVHTSGPFKVAALPGTLNGESGYFTCTSRTGRCGRSGLLSGGDWVFNSASLESGANADYLSGGAWLIVPDDDTQAADYEVGAYAQGRGTPWTQTQLSRTRPRLRGYAYYTGKAAGLLSRKGTTSNEIRRFSATARLTAHFNTRLLADGSFPEGVGTVNTFLQGEINSINIGGDGFKPNFNGIALQPAAFSSGGFSGEASSAYGQVDPGDQTHTVVGNWGARFYGRAQGEEGVPSSVAGTFAVSGTASGLTGFQSVSIVGAFGGNETSAK